MESDKDKNTSISPKRPVVPPKPDKEKISFIGSGGGGSKVSAEAQENNICKSPEIRKTTQNGEHSKPTEPEGITKSHSSAAVLTPTRNNSATQVETPESSHGPKPPFINPNLHHKPPISPAKPALPPKPGSNSISSPQRNSVASPPKTPASTPVQLFPKKGNSFAIANSILASKAKNSLQNDTTTTTTLATSTSKARFSEPVHPLLRKTDGFFSDPETSKSSAAVLRRDAGSKHFSKSPSEPVSPRPTFNSPPRPFSSIFSFPSPDTKVHPPAFQSSVNNSNKLAALRTKSASLGRNITPPTSSSGGFFSNKALTLSRILPLDLHFGKSSSKPRPQTLPAALPMQPSMMTSPIHNFGKKILFSTDSPIPPPPPPRKKKLSPVNSLSPVESLSPTSPLPVFSSPTPPMTSLVEEPVIYAEIDKEKKWAERKIKEVTKGESNSELSRSKSSDELNSFDQSTQQPAGEIQASLVISINSDSTDNSKTMAVQSQSQCVESIKVDAISSDRDKDITSQFKPQQLKSTINEGEVTVVDSWLGKYLSNPVAPVVPPKPKPSQDMHHINSKNVATKDPELNRIIFNAKINAEEEQKSQLSFEMVSSEPALESENATEVTTEGHLTENKSFLFSNLCNKEKTEDSLVPISTVTDSPEVIQEPEKNTLALSETTEKEITISVDVSEIGNTQDAEKCCNIDVVAVEPSENESCKSKVEEVEVNDVVKNESVNALTGEIPDAETMLNIVDANIQAVVTRLSNLSGKISPSSQNDNNKESLSESQSVGPAAESVLSNEFESLSISESNLSPTQESDKAKNSTDIQIQPNSSSTPVSASLETPETAKTVKQLAELISSGDSALLRRRSWNCSGDSSSPCESSSSSLCNLRDRSFTYSTRGTAIPCWVDEGDISTGALGDAESSDAPIPSSSTEDMGAVGSIARRKRSIWIFSSFGKAGSSSSGSSGGNQKGTVKRHKDKARSLLPDSNGKSSTFSRFGRQVSDSILSTAQISGPISLPENASPVISNHPQSTKTPQSHPTVQFSPNVSETHIYRYRYSESSISEAGELPPLLTHEQERAADNESLSSVSSAGIYMNSGGSSSNGGYEDILAELSPKDKKVFYVAREILTSEQTFVDVLDLLTIDFPNTIKRTEEHYGQPIITPLEMDEILGGLSNLKRVNQELKLDLENRIQNWRENPKLADIVVKKGPFLKLYAHYIKNFEKTTQRLDGCCRRNPLFDKALKEFEMSDRCQKLGLKHYMLKPVQRMPQYRLLLEDYLKHLDRSSNDYEDTVKAITIVRDVAEHANEAIRLQVNAEKLMHLQERLVGGTVIMKADRQMMKEGELLKVCRRVLQPRFFALMNDSLLCMTYNVGAGSSKDLKLRYELPLAGMRVCLTSTEDYPNEFSVISTARSFNLVAKSSREREDWMKALTDAIHDNIKKRTCTTPDNEVGFQLGKVAPVWIQDTRVTMCQICTAEFTVTFRRHHCRACGKVVCGHCSGNQAPLQYQKNDAARVCDECFQYLLDEFDQESRGNSSEGLETSRDIIRSRFKKFTPNVSKRATKVKRIVPSRLEIHANNSGSRISSYLHWRERKAWKKHWFVLMDRVLYIYAASEDIVAIRSIPVLGWNVDIEKYESMDGGENEAVFKLTHTGQNTLLFQAENPSLAEKWIAAMNEATVLT